MAPSIPRPSRRARCGSRARSAGSRTCFAGCERELRLRNGRPGMSGDESWAGTYNLGRESQAVSADARSQ